MKKTSQGNVEVQYYIPDKPPTERSPLLNTKSMGGSIYWPKDKGKLMDVFMPMVILLKIYSFSISKLRNSKAYPR